MPGQPAFFENQPIRRVYDSPNDTWWFSVVDIIKILTQQEDGRKAGTYWKVLKSRLSKEGSQLVTKCNQLKLLWLELLIEGGLHLPEPNAWPHSLPDSKDGPFLALAGTAGAWLVTGNLKHFPAKSRSGVTVISPAEYLSHLLLSGKGPRRAR